LALADALDDLLAAVFAAGHDWSPWDGLPQTV
jgi:hypothetical protein